MLHKFDRRNRPNTTVLLNIYREGIAEKAKQYTYVSSEHDRMRMAEEDFLYYVNTVFFGVHNAWYFLWENAGTYVAALRVEPYKDGTLLSALETTPALRNRGYGKCMVNSLICHLRSIQGLPLYSHIHKRNAISEHLHQICGFEKVSDYAILLDGTITSDYMTYSVEK